MKTLIVEDNPVNSLFVQKILAVTGECDVASDGHEAIQYFSDAIEENKPYDVVCLDIVMPGLDGQEVLKKIRHLETEKGINISDEAKVIMLTSVDDPDIIKETVKQGASDYLVKPILKDDLLDKIRAFGFIS